MYKIYVAIPTIRGEIERDCILAIYNHLTFDHKYDLKITSNSSLITKARSDHFGMFFNDPQYDYLLTIDSDIVSGLRFVEKNHREGPLDRLISRDKDFIAGLYGRRSVKNALPVIVGEAINPEELIIDGRLVQMQYVGNGFSLISRRCADLMVEKYTPELYYEDPNISCRWSWAMYNTMIAPDEKGIPAFYSEDFSFCRRWTDIGGEIWADTTIKLNHLVKVVYTLDHLEIKPDV